MSVLTINSNQPVAKRNAPVSENAIAFVTKKAAAFTVRCKELDLVREETYIVTKKEREDAYAAKVEAAQARINALYAKK